MNSRITDYCCSHFLVKINIIFLLFHLKLDIWNNNNQVKLIHIKARCWSLFQSRYTLSLSQFYTDFMMPLVELSINYPQSKNDTYLGKLSNGSVKKRLNNFFPESSKLYFSVSVFDRHILQKGNSANRKTRK